MKRLTYLTGFVLLLIAPVLPQIFGETTYFTSFAANFIFRNNFHEVVPGRFYRSASMDRDDLARTIQQEHIKTVIDLRLEDDMPDESGRTERSVAERNGAQYFHVPFSSGRADQKDSFEKLLRIYDTAQTPALVHCSSGTHRAGMASAVWLLEKEGASATRALEQISLRYGFIDAERRLKSLLRGHPTLDSVLKSYAQAQQTEPSTFRDWLEKQHSVERKGYAALSTD